MNETERESEIGEVFWTADEDFCSCDENNSTERVQVDPDGFGIWENAQENNSFDTVVCEFGNGMNYSNNNQPPPLPQVQGQGQAQQPHRPVPSCSHSQPQDQPQQHRSTQNQTTIQINDRQGSKPTIPSPKIFYNVAKFTAHSARLARPYRKGEPYGTNFESSVTTTQEAHNQGKLSGYVPERTVLHDPGVPFKYTSTATVEGTSITTLEGATKATSEAASTLPSNNVSRWVIPPNTRDSSSEQQTQTFPEYITPKQVDISTWVIRPSADLPNFNQKNQTEPGNVNDTPLSMSKSLEKPSTKHLESPAVKQKSTGNQKQKCAVTSTCYNTGKFDAYDRYVDHIKQSSPGHSDAMKATCSLKNDNEVGIDSMPKHNEELEEIGYTVVQSGSRILRNNEIHITSSDLSKCVRFSAFDETKKKEHDSLTKLQVDTETEPSTMNKPNTHKPQKVCQGTSPDSKVITHNATPLLDTQQLFYEMWMKKKFCDVTISVDGRNFDAHQVILAASSSYFEWLFLNTSTTVEETSRLLVTINDISGETFDSVLQFIYTSRITVEVGQIYELLRASLAFSIKPLTDAIQEYLLNTWKDNCIDAFCVAQATGLTELNDDVIKHIRANFLDVATSEHFATCPVEHVSVILADENLCVNQEIDILQAILLRLKHQTGKTGSNLRLLRHVKFESISQKSLEMLIQDVSLTNCHETVRRYIQDARKRTSPFSPEHLYFDPPVHRKHIWGVASRPEVGFGRSAELVQGKTSEVIESYHSSPKDEREQSAGKLYNGLFSHINLRWPERDQQASPRPFINKNPSVVTLGSRCPSQQEYERNAQDRILPPSAAHVTSSNLGSQFPSYHELDTGAISVTVSVSTQEMMHGPGEFRDAFTNPRTSQQACGQEPPSDCGHACLVTLGGVTSSGFDGPVQTVMLRDIPKGGNWKEVTALPVPMHHHSVCFVRNSIYVTGGHASTEKYGDHLKPSGLFYAFDLTDGRWYRLADMRHARIFHQSAALFGQIYIIGGQGDDGRALSSVERYSPYTNSWRAIAPMSFPRYAAAVAVYNFRLWIAGGVTGHVIPTNPANHALADGGTASTTTFVTPVVEYYSAHDNSWTKVADLPRPRCHAAMLRVGSRLYIVGGFAGSSRPTAKRNASTSTIDCLDVDGNAWKYVTDIEEGNYSNNTVTMGSKILIVGQPNLGVESTTLRTLTFDTATNEWTSHRSTFDYPPACIGNACCIVPASSNYIWREN